MLNLLSNAIKFSEFYGKIVILVNKHIDSQKGEFIQISVTDNGRGIKKKDKSKLFKPFSSIKSQTVN